MHSIPWKIGYIPCLPVFCKQVFQCLVFL
jgi:hypothetical protein